MPTDTTTKAEKDWAPPQKRVTNTVTVAPQDIAALLQLRISPPISIRGGRGPRQPTIRPEASVSDSGSAASTTAQESQPSQPRTLQKFRELPIIQRNTAVGQIIRKNISPCWRSPVGWIYIFQCQQWTAPGLLGNQQLIKIGHTGGETVEYRLRDIARTCKNEPQLLFAYAVPDPARYEALTHATLRNHRWREVAGCIGCKRKHNEWFDVDCEVARSVVRMWAFFAAQEPYDEVGV